MGKREEKRIEKRRQKLELILHRLKVMDRKIQIQLSKFDNEIKDTDPEIPEYLDARKKHSLVEVFINNFIYCLRQLKP